VGHHFYRQQFRQASNRNGLDLEPYIKIEKENITPKRELFHGIRFILDKDVLKTIQQAQQMGRHLDISPSLLADLRYYALTDGENRLQSGLTFFTYYLRGGAEEALMRSVISTDGDIFHQIKSECLERPNFCYQIAAAHYWLIEQLLGQLCLGTLPRLKQLKQLKQLKWLSWGLSLLIVAAIVILYLPQLIQLNPWLVLLPLVMLWLLQVILQHLLRLFLPTIGRESRHPLLSSLLSRKPLEY
jgi:hypothetical protein